MNTATQTIYTPVNIIPCNNGFGEWQLGQIEISPEHSYGLLSQLEREGELVALEDALQNPDFKEAGIKDIRGLIHNQPPLIYARLNEYSDGQVFINRVSYIGVVESEAPLDFYGNPSHNQQGEQIHQQIEAVFKANPMDYSNYTAQFSTEPSYYGQDCDQKLANEIVGRLQMMVEAEFPGIKTHVWRDGDGSASTLGPDESVCERIDKWIEENWTKAI